MNKLIHGGNPAESAEARTADGAGRPIKHSLWNCYVCFKCGIKYSSKLRKLSCPRGRLYRHSWVQDCLHY